MKQLLCIFSMIVLTYTWGQKDSLMQAWHVYEKIENHSATQSDSVLVLDIQQALYDIMVIEPEVAIHRAHLMLKLSRQISFEEGIAGGLLQLANTHMNAQNLDSAEYWIDQGIKYCEKNKRHRQIMVGRSIRGNIHYYRSEYDEALTDYFAAIKVADEHYPDEAAAKYANVGLVFWTIGNNTKSESYLEKSYQLAKIYKDTSTQIYALNNLGIACKNQGKNEKAKEYYETGLELAVLTGEIRREGEFVYNLANIYFSEGNDKQGFKLLERSAEITNLIGNDRDKAIEYANMGQHLFEAGEYRKAYDFSKDGLHYARLTKYWEVELEALETMANASYKLGKYKEAFEYSYDFKMLQDSLDLNKVNAEALAVEEQHRLEQEALKDSLLQEKYALEQKHQKKLHDEKLKSRDNLLWVAAGVIALIIMGLIFLYRTNKKVKQKNEIITKQKDEIEEVHKEITDSINYAQRIQNALISGNEEWDKVSMEHYIFFQPKDVVSGDFYWAHHADEENISIWVTADCTGHGVPGAFMSMLGIGFLNEIIIENGLRNGTTILNLLRDKIIKALKQKNVDHQQRDGMDMSLCIWDKNNNTLEYTGANNGLYLIRKTEMLNFDEFDKCMAHPKNGFSLAELRANKMPVGFQSDKLEDFESRSVKLEKDDVIITFTDGYADQFGGEKGKKLKYKPFKEMLLDIQTKPIKLHGHLLNEAFTEWKGDLEQVDDVCVIGVRIS